MIASRPSLAAAQKFAEAGAFPGFPPGMGIGAEADEIHHVYELGTYNRENWVAAWNALAVVSTLLLGVAVALLVTERRHQQQNQQDCHKDERHQDKQDNKDRQPGEAARLPDEAAQLPGRWLWWGYGCSRLWHHVTDEPGHQDQDQAVPSADDESGHQDQDQDQQEEEQQQREQQQQQQQVVAPAQPQNNGVGCCQSKCCTWLWCHGLWDVTPQQMPWWLHLLHLLCSIALVGSVLSCMGALLTSTVFIMTINTKAVPVAFDDAASIVKALRNPPGGFGCNAIPSMYKHIASTRAAAGAGPVMPQQATATDNVAMTGNATTTSDDSIITLVIANNSLTSAGGHVTVAFGNTTMVAAGGNITVSVENTSMRAAGDVNVTIGNNAPLRAVGDNVTVTVGNAMINAAGDDIRVVIDNETMFTAVGDIPVAFETAVRNTSLIVMKPAGGNVTLGAASGSTMIDKPVSNDSTTCNTAANFIDMLCGAGQNNIDNYLIVPQGFTIAAASCLVVGLWLHLLIKEPGIVAILSFFGIVLLGAWFGATLAWYTSKPSDSKHQACNFDAFYAY